MNKIKKEFNWEGMLIITILMLAGFAIIYFTWGGMEINYENIYNYFYKEGMLIIFALFFIIIGLYCWEKFISNVIIKPKKETLYLKRVDRRNYTFIDYKGKKYTYVNYRHNVFDVGKYYTVIKTKDMIQEVLDISKNTFPVPKEKISFWLNWYSPFGKLEDVLFLPIIYVIFLPFFLSFIMAKSFDKLYGLFLMIIPGFFIAYDIIYKVKRGGIFDKIETISDIEYQNNEVNEIDSNRKLSNMRKKWSAILCLFPSFSQTISGLIFTGICIWVFIKAADNITRIAISLFIVCGLVILCKCIIEFIGTLDSIKTSKSKKNSDEYINRDTKRLKLIVGFSKLYIIIFLLMWFGFLSFWCYLAIKQNSYQLVLFTIPFWIAGIVIIYKKLIK